MSISPEPLVQSLRTMTMSMGHGAGNENHTSKAGQLSDIVLPVVEKAVGHLQDLYAGRVGTVPASDHPAGRLVDLLGQAEHLTNAGMSKAALPALGLAGQAAGKECAARASTLRSRLAEFACLAPVEDLDADANCLDKACSPEFATLQKLAACRDSVSCNEALSRKESLDILRTLLRAERAIAELQRTETACNRRWDALSQEVRQASDKIKVFRSRAKKLQERQGDVHMAGTSRRQELWERLLQAAESGDATAVHGQLLASDMQRQELLGRISADREKLHRIASKRRQTQDTVDMLMRISREQDSHDASGRHSVDAIVDAELELEALVWQKIKAEQMAQLALPVASPSPPRAEINSPHAFDTRASDSPSFAPCLPGDLGELEHLDEPASPSRPRHFSQAGQSSEAEEELQMEVKQAPSAVTPKVANLIERLSLCRDARRQAEREQRSRAEDRKPPEPAAEQSGARLGEADLSRPQPDRSSLPNLPGEEGEGQPQAWQPRPGPPSHTSPEQLWGCLPSSPLTLPTADAGQAAARESPHLR